MTLNQFLLGSTKFTLAIGCKIIIFPVILEVSHAIEIEIIGTPYTHIENRRMLWKNESKELFLIRDLKSWEIEKLCMDFLR